MVNIRIDVEIGGVTLRVITVKNPFQMLALEAMEVVDKGEECDRETDTGDVVE